MNINEQLAKELNIRLEQVNATVKLIDEGNTIPFIARYRKEATGALNDEILRTLDERLTYLRNLEEKKAQVIASIEEQGKLTPELKAQIEEAMTQVVVDDLYRPYRPKRRTRATVAVEKGLQPLADYILAQEAGADPEAEAAKYISEEKEVKDANEALAGAKDIIAEQISDNADYRKYIREQTFENGMIVSSRKDKAEKEKEKTKEAEKRVDASVYEMYFEYEERINKIPGHRILALNRGEAEKVLSVKITAPTEQILRFLEKMTVTGGNEACTKLISEACADSYDRLIAPAIEREIRNDLTEKAEDGAIKVFGKNLHQLLMQPPVAGRTVLGWDPAFRTGCKLAVVDPTGKVLDTVVIYPTAPQFKVAEAKRTLTSLINKYDISLISVGNGTASRESEQVIVELIKELKKPVQYVIVSEAGASVYSASKLATEEFPNFDVGQRSAASIARRLQDPLAELVKIDPKSIGVGQYQHDMDQKKLGDSLEGVVENCVNTVGVDLNTASASLLEYVSGISKPIAKNIVAYREENGKFKDRRELLKVPKLGPKAFEQCAGFLRITGGTNPLDATGVHPESYAAAEALLAKLGLSTADIGKVHAETREAVAMAAEQEKQANREQRRDNRREKPVRSHMDTNTAMGQALLAALGGTTLGGAPAKENRKPEKQAPSKPVNVPSGLSKKIGDKHKLAEELGIGELTLEDIIKEIEKPGRDPREEMQKPILRTDVLDMADLKEGMILKGTVRNVIDFGVFVDIGVHQDGLVHISQITNERYIKHPLDAVSVGDIVDVKVLGVDTQKKRISLSMII
jgi:uncharacterized protein